MTITVGSLCSGYDGIGRGLSLVMPDLRTLWHAENDADMSTVLAKHEPDVVNVGDLLTAPWHLAPPVDLVTSGDPCQSMSAAGRQLASHDERFLWPDVIGVIRTVAPQVVFLENVQNLISVPLYPGGPKGGVLKLRLDDLRAAGYECRWTVLGACAVGAPHHRHRWYLLGRKVPAGRPVPGAVRVGVKALCGAPARGGRSLSGWRAERDHRGPGTARMERGEAPWHDLPTHVALLPTPLVRDSDLRNEGSPEYWAARPGKAMPLGAAVTMMLTPAARDGGERGSPSRGVFRRRAADPMRSTNAVALLPTPTGQNSHGNTVNNRGELLLPGIAADPERWGKYAEAVALWEQITGVPAPDPTVAGAKGGRRLSPLLPEWMMGLPTGLLAGHLPRAAAIKGAGNGVVPLAVAAAWKVLTA